jgi:hypothetical protein
VCAGCRVSAPRLGGDGSDGSDGPCELEHAAQCDVLERLAGDLPATGSDAAHSSSCSSCSSSSSSSSAEEGEDEEGHSTSAEESCALSNESDDQSYDSSGEEAAYGEGPDPTTITEHATKCRSLERMILGLPGGEQWWSETEQGGGGRKRRGAGSRHSGTSRGSTTAPGSSLASLESDSDSGCDDATASSGSDHEDGGEGAAGEGAAASGRKRRLSWGAALILASTSSEHASECRSLEAMISHLTDKDDGGSGEEDEDEDSEDEMGSEDSGKEGSEDEAVEVSSREGSCDGDASGKELGSTAAEAQEAEEVEEDEGALAVAVSGAALAQLPDHLLSLVFGCVVEISDGTEAGRRDWRRHTRLRDHGPSAAHATWATDANEDADEKWLRAGEREAEEEDGAPFSWASYSAVAMAKHAALTAPLRLVSRGCRDALASGCALRACVAQGQLLGGDGDVQPGLGGRPWLAFGLAALKVAPPETHAKPRTHDDDEREQVRRGRRVGAGLCRGGGGPTSHARLCAPVRVLTPTLFLNRGDSTWVYSTDPGGSGAAGAPRAGVATAPRA